MAVVSKMTRPCQGISNIKPPSSVLVPSLELHSKESALEVLDEGFGLPLQWPLLDIDSFFTRINITFTGQFTYWA
jgi:hypothetical protein